MDYKKTLRDSFIGNLINCKPFPTFYLFSFEPTEVEGRARKMTDGQSPSETFIHCSQLLTEGSPSVYLLEAIERASFIPELRWFDIGAPSDEKRLHKVLILMGAKGSGKRTLINGMVNYVLGVEWNDPFRFRIADKDQTVTAYTIHQVQGMKIDYDLTVIDTPSYGGLGRDREITDIIGRCLADQSDAVSAVCFVAKSFDSFLTPAQKHGLQSAKSLFGPEIIGSSFRLLVTFADGMKPSVLDATAKILDSNIVQHHKFNNSALFASNSLEEDDHFGKVYWDLCQTNFLDFFAMLGKMPCQSLHPIGSRIKSNFERPFIAAEQEQTVGQDIINEVIDSSPKEEEKQKQIACEPFKMAYNCTRCKTTCQELQMSWLLSVQNTLGLIYCQNDSCPCKSEHHQLESVRWVMMNEP